MNSEGPVVVRGLYCWSMAESLSSRVHAPRSLERPAATPEATWRAATEADVDAILDCETAIAAVDHPRYVTSREEIEDDFRLSYVDLGQDTIVAVGSDGRVLAWGVVIATPDRETLVRSILAGGVRPSARGRGLGRQLLAWQEGRGRQQLATSDADLPGWLVSYADSGAVETRRLLERTGFAPARYFLEVTRDLAEPVQDRPTPEGVRIEPFTEDLWESTRLARNDAFRDHWGSLPVSEETWLAFARRQVSRAEWSFVALGEDAAGGWQVVGFVLAQANEQDWPLQGFTSGYVDLVGTRRDWRGRGLASALLSRTIRAVAADGIQKLVLDVDSESPTGALGLYTGLGFVESASSASYTKVF